MSKNIEYCKKCLYPNTRPRLKFIDGICKACIEYPNNREEKLEELKKIIHENLSHPIYDCIIPCSGGKDSYFVVDYILKLGFNPLLIRIDGFIPTPEGEHNWKNMIEVFNVPYLIFGEKGS